MEFKCYQVPEPKGKEKGITLLITKAIVHSHGRSGCDEHHKAPNAFCLYDQMQTSIQKNIKTENFDDNI